LTDAESNSVHDAIEDVPSGNSRMDVSPEANINSVRSGMHSVRQIHEFIV
jgi:hypothetical protein